MENAINKCKKALGEFFFLVCFFVPILVVKVRAGVTFQEGLQIARFFCSAALYRKQPLYAAKVFILLFFKVKWKNFSPDYSLFSKKHYKTPLAVRKVGEWYSIKPEVQNDAPPVANTKSIQYFSIGREAIFCALKSRNFDRKVVLLPIFTCFTVLTPFLQDGWKICFYRYNKDLSINTQYFEDVFRKESPSLCVFQPLSGMGFLDAENALIDLAHHNGCATVVDQTQDIYNDRGNPSVDFYCGSLRKWYPFPDGAFLSSNKHKIVDNRIIKENCIYRTSMGLCMFSQHLNANYTNPFFAYLYSFMWTFSVCYIGNTKIVPHSMSDYSRKVLAQQDEAFNASARIRNFHYIYEGIRNLKTIRPAFESIERLTSVPLSFPIYVENRNRFSHFLLSKGITTQLLWAIPPYIKKNIPLDATTRFIYDHILSLPCDQRYSTDDMRKMVELIREYDSQA